MTKAYARFRQKCERMMPVLFIGSLILLGMSAGRHDVTNAALYGVSAIGTLPNFHKDSWRFILCPQDVGRED